MNRLHTTFVYDAALFVVVVVDSSQLLHRLRHGPTGGESGALEAVTFDKYFKLTHSTPCCASNKTFSSQPPIFTHLASKCSLLLPLLLTILGVM